MISSCNTCCSPTTRTDGRRTLQELDLTGLALAPTLEGRKAIDRERREGLRELRRDWDRLRFELAVGDLDLDAIEAAREPEPAVPTMGELRQQAKALGIPAPPPRRDRPTGSERGKGGSQKREEKEHYRKGR